MSLISRDVSASVHQVRVSIRIGMLTASLMITPASSGDILGVGPGQSYPTPCAAINAVNASGVDGHLIEINASGDYTGDVCTITANGVTLRGVGGLATIDANGTTASGKAIWVVAGDDTVVENIEFAGAASLDLNGAGIRQEGNNLTVRNCYFHDNENGILAIDRSDSEILIESSEFAYNGYGDGYSHNIYIGRISRFTLRYSYSHHANAGHLVKSRAEENYILYNRLTSEYGSFAHRTSYELDIPDGGRTHVVGNLIEKGSDALNSTLISYARESQANTVQELVLVNNTLVNDKITAVDFVSAGGTGPGSVLAQNNIFAGQGAALRTSLPIVLTSNHYATQVSDVRFVGAENHDYRLDATSPVINIGTEPDESLRPAYHYLHPLTWETRSNVGVIDIGAYEYLGGGGGETPVPDPTPPSIRRIAIDSKSSSGQQVIPGQVTLDRPAPQRGIELQFSASNQLVVPNPGALVIPEGSTVGFFELIVAEVTYKARVEIVATLGEKSKVTRLRLVPAKKTPKGKQ